MQIALANGRGRRTRTPTGLKFGEKISIFSPFQAQGNQIYDTILPLVFLHFGSIGVKFGVKNHSENRCKPPLGFGVIALYFYTKASLLIFKNNPSSLHFMHKTVCIIQCTPFSYYLISFRNTLSQHFQLRLLAVPCCTEDKPHSSLL